LRQRPDRYAIRAGRHRAGVRPYTSCSTSQSPVFLVNSRLGLFIATPARSAGQAGSRVRSTPSPEVTGQFCRVPKRGFSLAPEDFLLAYLCRFAVRVPNSLLRGFSRQRGVNDFATLRSRFGTSGLATHRICLADLPTCLNLAPFGPLQARLASCVPPSVITRTR
jgi:hypothetical protein